MVRSSLSEASSAAVRRVLHGSGRTGLTPFVWTLRLKILNHPFDQCLQLALGFNINESEASSWNLHISPLGSPSKLSSRDEGRIGYDWSRGRVRSTILCIGILCTHDLRIKKQISEVDGRVNPFQKGQRVMVGPDTAKVRLVGCVGRICLTYADYCMVSLDEYPNCRWSFLYDELLSVFEEEENTSRASKGTTRQMATWS